jgi:predicted PurR-regulated permease PerM
MKRFALAVLIVLALCTAAIILWRISSIVFLFLGSLAIAAAARAPIEAISSRGVPRAVGVALVYGVLIILLGALAFFFYQALGQELGNITEDLSNIYRTLVVRWGGQMAENLPALSARLPTPEELGQALGGEGLMSVVQRLSGVTSGLTTFLTFASIAIVVSIYWIADRLRFERVLLSLLPATQRPRARAMWRTLESGVGAYLRSELVQSVMAALLLAPAFALMGLNYPIFWALVGALTWFVPLVGALIFLIPLWLVTWVQDGTLIATVAVVYSLGVVGFLELVVERRMYAPEGRSNILVLLVMLAMFDAFGLAGLLLAPPVAMAIYIFLTELITPTMAGAQQEALSPNVSTLEARLNEVREVVAGMEAGSVPRLSSMTERMGQLLAQVREVDNSV